MEDPFKPTRKFQELEEAAGRYFGHHQPGVPDVNWREEAVITQLPPTSGLADGDLDLIAIDYPDYDETSTFIVSGPLVGTAGADSPSPLGTPRTTAEARRWAIEKYGDRLMSEITLPYRWAFRVRRA